MTGPKRIFVIFFKLFGIYSNRRQPKSSQQKDKRGTRYPGQAGSQSGTQPTNLIELDGQQQARFVGELIGTLLKSPQYIFRNIDCE